MKPRTYTEIPPDRWGRIQGAAQAKTGLAISGDKGQASKLGIAIEWEYIEATQVLTIKPTAKPFFFSDGTVYEMIDGFIYSTP